MKRHGMSRGYSKKLFRKTAGNRRVHKKNFVSPLERGGERL